MQLQIFHLPADLLAHERASAVGAHDISRTATPGSAVGELPGVDERGVGGLFYADYFMAG